MIAKAVKSRGRSRHVSPRCAVETVALSTGRQRAPTGNLDSQVQGASKLALLHAFNRDRSFVQNRYSQQSGLGEHPARRPVPPCVPPPIASVEYATIRAYNLPDGVIVLRPVVGSTDVGSHRARRFRKRGCLPPASSADADSARLWPVDAELSQAERLRARVHAELVGRTTIAVDSPQTPPQHFLQMAAFGRLQVCSKTLRPGAASPRPVEFEAPPQGDRLKGIAIGSCRSSGTYATPRNECRMARSPPLSRKG